MIKTITNINEALEVLADDKVSIKAKRILAISVSDSLLSEMCFFKVHVQIFVLSKYLNYHGKDWVADGVFSKSHLKKWNEIESSINKYCKTLQALSINLSIIHLGFINGLFDETKDYPEHQKMLNKQKKENHARGINLVDQYKSKNIKKQIKETLVTSSQDFTQLIYELLVVNSAILESPLHKFLSFINTSFEKDAFYKFTKGLYKCDEKFTEQSISNFLEFQELYSKDSFPLVCLLDEMMQFRLKDKFDSEIQMKYTMAKKEKIKELLDHYLGV